MPDEAWEVWGSRIRLHNWRVFSWVTSGMMSSYWATSIRKFRFTIDNGGLIACRGSCGWLRFGAFDNFSTLFPRTRRRYGPHFGINVRHARIPSHIRLRSRSSIMRMSIELAWWLSAWEHTWIKVTIEHLSIRRLHDLNWWPHARMTVPHLRWWAHWHWTDPHWLRWTRWTGRLGLRGAAGADCPRSISCRWHGTNPWFYIRLWRWPHHSLGKSRWHWTKWWMVARGHSRHAWSGHETWPRRTWVAMLVVRIHGWILITCWYRCSIRHIGWYPWSEHCFHPRQWASWWEHWPHGSLWGLLHSQSIYWCGDGRTGGSGSLWGGLGRSISRSRWFTFQCICFCSIWYSRTTVGCSCALLHTWL